MESKKAQGISINVIIIAVIALLVLVVLMVVFSGQIGHWGEGVNDAQTKSCTDRGDLDPGMVVPFDQDCGEDYSASFYKYSDVSNGFKCCVPV